MSKRISQPQHDQMVKYVANLLVEKGYTNVKADLPGFEKPVEIKWKKTGQGHVPDITGRKEELGVFEVETADSIDDKHTKDQWILFAKHCKENDIAFWVVVPQNSVEAAKQRLNALDIDAKVWGV